MFHWLGQAGQKAKCKVGQRVPASYVQFGLPTPGLPRPEVFGDSTGHKVVVSAIELRHHGPPPCIELFECLGLPPFGIAIARLEATGDQLRDLRWNLNRLNQVAKEVGESLLAYVITRAAQEGRF